MAPSSGASVTSYDWYKVSGIDEALGHPAGMCQLVKMMPLGCAPEDMKRSTVACSSRAVSTSEIGMARQA